MGVDYAEVVAAGQAWVLLLNDEIIGVIELKDRPEALLIPNVAVLSRHHGSGYGKLLLTLQKKRPSAEGIARYASTWARGWTKTSLCTGTSGS
jgi:Acetyltransferase (GNAT) domain